MTKQSLQLSALALVGSLTTLLRTPFSSVLEPRSFSLSVVDIYRRISFVQAKVKSFFPLINCPTKLVTTELRINSEPTANISLNEVFKNFIKPLSVYETFSY
ncbi:MAG: hypothetical protein IT235_07070 [Bacteroidia bacterium]|nr:hypothetical protein [Bacteroidia bacterium]